MENENNGRLQRDHGDSGNTTPATVPATAEDVVRASRAAENAAYLLQEVEAAGRRQQTRAFAAGFAGSSLGRILGEAGKKLLDRLDWLGLA